MAKQDLIQRYEEAYGRYENRIKSWTKKFHAVMKQVPKVKYSKNITEKSIERLEKQKWGEFSQRKRKEGRKRYEILYENKSPSVYTPKPPYEPPSEQDYFNNPDYDEDYDREWEEQHPGWDEPDEDGYTYTVDSEAELRAWITEVIDSVVVTKSPWGTPNEIYGERERIKQLVESAFNNAKNKFGEERKFLKYLQDNARKFNELTLKAIHGYESKGQIVYIEQGGEQALGNILTLLNFGHPISQWAEEEVTYGNYDAVFWGSGEDFYE